MKVSAVAVGVAIAVSFRMVARLKLTAPPRPWPVAGGVPGALPGREGFPAMSVRHTLKMYHYLA
jgi:hypothetical protein